jgi:RNAse (barnase) inhibitor barstar
MEYSAIIDGSKIKDLESFHDEFQSSMGFFEGYGRNTNAWIDCMTDMYTNGEYKSLTKFNLNDEDRFILKIINSEEWKKSDPETFNAFIDYCIWSNDERTHFLVEFKKGI